MTNTHHEYWKRRKQRQKMNKFGVTIDITHLHRSIQICGSSIPVSSESIWAIFWEQQQPVFKYVDGLLNIILSLFHRECFLSIGIFEEKKIIIVEPEMEKDLEIIVQLQCERVIVSKVMHRKMYSQYHRSVFASSFLCHSQFTPRNADGNVIWLYT